MYFYKIKPSFSGSIESDANCSKRSPFTSGEGMELTGNCYAGTASAVAVEGHYVYIGDYSNRINVDISNPLNITPTSPFHYLADSPRDVDLDETKVYLTQFNGSLVTLDKSTLSFIETAPFPGSLNRISVDGNYACMTDYYDKLIIYNLYSHSAKFYGGIYSTDVTLIGSLAYVTDKYSGLLLINIFPDTSIIQDFCDTPGYSDGMCLSGNYAFVADGASGIQVIDISAPSSPTIIAGLDISGNAVSVVVTGSCAYVVNDGVDIKVVKLLQ